MRPAVTYLAWGLATVILASGTAFVVSRRPPAQPAPLPSAGGVAPGSEGDFHRWMHERLEITPEQMVILEPYEDDFETERERLRGEISRAGRLLADAVREGEAGSVEIDAALGDLNAARADLQRITLDHFFKMKEHLDPAQAEKLLQWTHDSIVPE